MREQPVEERTSRVVEVCDRGLVPTLQNRVYATRERALEAPVARLRVVFSENTQFAFNACFDPELITYDTNYDNTVCSPRFVSYYEEVIDYLYCTYGLADRTIIDIGCGKGDFLKMFVRRKGDVRGIGIDPAYVGETQDGGGRLRFVCDVFKQEHLTEHPGLLLSRHTLEHIYQPIEFLRCVFEPLKHLHDVPVFVEVPDLAWIVRHAAFWDFCYEHCNYFTARSIATALQDAGAVVTRVQTAFESQYLWAEAILNPSHVHECVSLPFLTEQDVLDSFARTERNVQFTASKLCELQPERQVVIWGMATKGIVYSGLLARCGFEPHLFVDQNPTKQDHYTPVTGFCIDSPEALRPGIAYAVVCMNSNYAEEIKRFCHTRQLDVLFLTPDLSPLSSPELTRVCSPDWLRKQTERHAHEDERE